MRKHASTLVAVGMAAGALWMARRMALRNYSFAGKVVVITGGSRGLGLALARRLARENARIALVSRDRAELARALQDIQQHGGHEVFSYPCDVRKKSQVIQTMHEIMEYFGRIDVLINNAGLITVGPHETMTDEDYQIAMDLHFWGPLFTIEAALPAMHKCGGARIVNIASFGGKIAVPHMAPYCASKFALVGLSDALRSELAESGIKVLTVCPGLMRTGSHLNAFFKGDNEAEFTWFAGGMGIPGSAMSADAAARDILDACRKGQAELTLSLKARMAVITQALFPNTTARMAQLVNRFLPHGKELKERRSGWQSRAHTPPELTERADEATENLNGLRGHVTARRFSGADIDDSR